MSTNVTIEITYSTFHVKCFALFRRPSIRLLLDRRYVFFSNFPSTLVFDCTPFWGSSPIDLHHKLSICCTDSPYHDWFAPHVPVTHLFPEMGPQKVYLVDPASFSVKKYRDQIYFSILTDMKSIRDGVYWSFGW